jgi:hypothetical protein
LSLPASISAVSTGWATAGAAVIIVPIARPNAVLLSIVSPLFDPRCPIAAVDGTIELAGVFARDPVTNYP